MFNCVLLSLASDMHKNTIVEYANLCIKENILKSSNRISKLEQWQVEVKSTRRKVKILKSKDIF